MCDDDDLSRSCTLVCCYCGMLLLLVVLFRLVDVSDRSQEGGKAPQYLDIVCVVFS